MYSISFIYDKNLVNFEKRTKKDLYTDIIDWLYNNGYKFDGPLHNPFSRKILSLDDIKKLIKSRTSYRLDHFHNISSSGNYILCNKFGTAQGFDDIFKMLDNFEILKSSIKTKGLESEIKIKKNGEVDVIETEGLPAITTPKIKRFGQIEISDDIQDVSDEDDNKIIEKKMTFLFACQFVLKQNDNRPMNSHEIFEEIKKKNLVNTNGLTPQATINAQMILYSINTIAKNKKKNSIFQIIEGTKPYKFILLNPDNIQNVPDEDLEDEDLENLEDDLDNFEIHRFSNFNKSNFKASQSQEEVESIDFNKNPFGGVKDSSAICILGKSGSGKSTSTEIALEKMGHEYELMLAIDGEYTLSLIHI